MAKARHAAGLRANILAAVLLIGPFLCRFASAAPGRSGMEFLRVNPSPRVAAMGDAGVASPEDATSALAINAAGLPRLAHPEAAFVYNAWLTGMTYHHLAYAHPLDGGRRGALAVSGTMLLHDKIEGYDNTGARAEDVGASARAFRAAYGARILGDAKDRRFGLFAGGGIRYVREELERVAAATMLYDAGVLWHGQAGLSSIGLGASIEGLGSGLKYDRERDPAPTIARYGASWSLPLFQDPLTLAFDVRQPLQDGLSYGLGFEYAVRRVLSWRMGWTSERDLGTGLRFGVGFNLKLVRLDYALTHFGDFGYTHRIGLSTRFGESLKPSLPVRSDDQERAILHVQRGDALVREKKFYEAALEYNEALKLDPLNRDALRKLRQVRDYLELTK